METTKEEEEEYNAYLAELELEDLDKRLAYMRLFKYNPNRITSPETRKKISNALKKHWEKVRETARYNKAYIQSCKSENGIFFYQPQMDLSEEMPFPTRIELHEGKYPILDDLVPNESFVFPAKDRKSIQRACAYRLKKYDMFYCMTPLTPTMWRCWRVR